jgi:hypothetical protein
VPVKILGGFLFFNEIQVTALCTQENRPLDEWLFGAGASLHPPLFRVLSLPRAVSVSAVPSPAPLLLFLGSPPRSTLAESPSKLGTRPSLSALPFHPSRPPCELCGEKRLLPWGPRPCQRLTASPFSLSLSLPLSLSMSPSPRPLPPFPRNKVPQSRRSFS